MAKPAAKSTSAGQRTKGSTPGPVPAPVKKTPRKGTAAKAGSRKAGAQSPAEPPPAPRSPRPDLGQRHVFGTEVRRALPDVSKIVKVPKSKALPGENEILTFAPGRGPIGDDEALGRLRRTERIKMAAAGDVNEVHVPSDLPEWGLAPTMMSVRFPRRLKALLDAKAEVEQISLSAYLELLVWEDVTRGVRDPEDVRRALIAMRKETLGPEWLDKEFGV